MIQVVYNAYLYILFSCSIVKTSSLTVGKHQRQTTSSTRTSIEHKGLYFMEINSSNFSIKHCIEKHSVGRPKWNRSTDHGQNEQICRSTKTVTGRSAVASNTYRKIRSTSLKNVRPAVTSMP